MVYGFRSSVVDNLRLTTQSMSSQGICSHFWLKAVGPFMGLRPMSLRALSALALQSCQVADEFGY